MRQDSPTRKLAAILAADVVGYTRLMRMDEAGTHAQLKAHRKEVFDPAIAEHHGRIVKTIGDGLLVEFPSVVDAVACAVEVQRATTRRNTGVREDQRVEFRIGINLGDVIVDDGDIYGDGVNVASRLEGLAAPGTICISQAVYEQVRNRRDFAYEPLGQQTVKNIAEPVSVYRVRLAPEADVDSPAGKSRPWRAAAVAVAGLAVLLVAGVAALWLQPWSLLLRDAHAPEATLSHPAKPSIAVLPLDNLSGDPAQDYFSDGIAENIITELSRFSNLLVIARNSSFSYKGQPTDIRQIGRDLGVRYVLEGSVQRSADRVRITVQLIDAADGHHLWAERYDRTLDDLFAVQDEITRQVVAALAVKVTRAELSRALAKPTDNLDAYDHVLRGRELLARATRAANREAREMFEAAIATAPRYAPAYVGLGRAHLDAALFGWTEWVDRALDQAHDLGQKAVSLDERSAEAHGLLGQLYLHRGQYERAIAELERAIALNPNDAASHAVHGTVLLWSSRPDNAIRSLETALRLDPNIEAKGLMTLGLAYYLKERYGDAVALLQRGAEEQPDFLPFQVVLAAAYGQMERREEAAAAAAAVLRLDPFFEIDSFTSLLPNPAHRAHLAAGLRKAASLYQSAAAPE